MSALLLLAALLAVRDSYPPIAAAPAATAWSRQCLARRQALTCVCMTNMMQRSGEGQFALALAEPDADAAALLASHGVAAEPRRARAFRKAAKSSAKDALAACR